MKIHKSTDAFSPRLRSWDSLWSIGIPKYRFFLTASPPTKFYDFLVAMPTYARYITDI